MKKMAKGLFKIDYKKTAIVTTTEYTNKLYDYSIPLEELLEFEPSDEIVNNIINYAKAKTPAGVK